MTKDELKKKAEKYAEQCYGWTNNDLALDVAKATYIASAEPREKKIEELEQENAELKEQLNFKTRYVKGEKAIEQLTQAKEIIKGLLESKTDFDEKRFVLWVWKKEVEKAEQFLEK